MERMKVDIHMAISQSVTKKEWGAVYKESLKLVNAFPLTETGYIKIYGIEILCMFKTGKRERYILDR